MIRCSDFFKFKFLMEEFGENQHLEEKRLQFTNSELELAQR